MGHDATRAEEVCAGQTPGNCARLPALAAGARRRLKIHRAGNGSLDQAGHSKIAEETPDPGRSKGGVSMALGTGDLFPVILNFF